MKTLSLFFLILSFNTVSAQQSKSVPLKQKAQVLVRLMEKKHYQPLVWNDSSSLMLYQKWLNELDEDKLLFTAGDIQQLAGYGTRLDEELQGKPWSFFTASVNIFKKRLNQTDSIRRILLARPFEFAKPDHLGYPFSDFAANEQELLLRWQRHLKWQVLEYIADQVTDDGLELNSSLPAKFTALETAARARLTITDGGLGTFPAEMLEELEDAYLSCIAWCYDPHSAYMSTREKKEFDTRMSASAYTAGFEVDENNKGEKVIGFLQPGGSAWRSGKIHNGDVLIKVKINGTEQSVAELSQARLEELLGGNSMADVEITVRTAAGEQKSVKLPKEKIEDDESIVKSYVLQGKKNIGYINLPGFYSREHEEVKSTKDLTYDGCANDVSKEVIKLKKDSIAGLILDLRSNGGGSMWEAMQLAGIFIDIGPVAAVKEKDGKVQFLKDPNRGTIYDGPMLVLINGLSASASEFVSAVLQDYNRAIIMGSTSYGKGTAQLISPMDTNTVVSGKSYDDYLRITERKFYRVNGGTTQWSGVVPDILLPDLYADEGFKEKANLSALKPDQTKTGFYTALPALPLELLKSRSQERVAENKYFKAITLFNSWVQEKKRGRQIPLQWQGYSTQYQKTMDMFGMLKDNNKPGVVSVRNNAFDRHRISMSTGRTKDINDTYLEQIRADEVLGEAYKVLLDWQSN